MKGEIKVMKAGGRFTISVVMLLLAVVFVPGRNRTQAAESGQPQEQETEQLQERQSEMQQEQDVNQGETQEESSVLAVPSVTGALHVEGTRLMGSNGEPVQLRGISTHGLAWFPDYINQACFAQLHSEWKANLIRLAMYTAEYGGYCTDGDKEALKQLVRNGVQYAANEDMYAIVDWHILSDNNPNIYLNEAKQFFEEMSAQFADADNVLYEICNEPNGGTSWSEIKYYAEQVIEVIRANDKAAVIIVGTPNWSQFVDQAAADPIAGYENVMYTLHFYAATHKEDLRNKMVEAVKGGLPIFVTEFGICDASGNGALDLEQADLWIKTMDEYGISYAAWNMSNKDESSAMFKSSCTKTSDFTWDDLSGSGKWLYQTLIGEKMEDAVSDTSDDSAQGNTAGESVQGDDTGDSTPGTGTSDTSSNGSGVITWQSEGLEIVAVLQNSWEADGADVSLYDLTIKNTSDSDCTSWAVDILFDGEIALSDGWNGDYTEDGNVLHITSKDYNGTIAAGTSIRDIGFIVSGGRMVLEQSEISPSAPASQNKFI